MRLKEKVALVTGGGSGIGEAIARRFAREGAQVVVADLNFTRARKVVELFEAEGGVATALKVDIRDETQVKSLIEKTLELYSGLDILVNNAGLGRAGYIDEIPLEAWDQVVDTNLKSLYFTCHHAIPHLKQRPGARIVNIASVEGIRGSGPTPAYAASKHGVIGLTRSLALALAPFQVTANAICPGFIATRMTRAILNVPELAETCRRSIPMGRIGTADDVAKAALFLASEEADYITGHALVVDGGLTVGSGIDLPGHF